MLYWEIVHRSTRCVLILTCFITGRSTHSWVHIQISSVFIHWVWSSHAEIKQNKHRTNIQATFASRQIEYLHWNNLSHWIALKSFAFLTLTWIVWQTDLWQNLLRAVNSWIPTQFSLLKIFYNNTNYVLETFHFENIYCFFCLKTFPAALHPVCLALVISIWCDFL